ncbi:SKU5 similar 13 [Raphanus sativus]|nr:SKU5 similar 13 [Raphanus sativus]
MKRKIRQRFRAKQSLTVFVCLVSTVALVNAGDPYFYYTWNVTYGTAAPLGIPQQVILINGEFPAFPLDLEWSPAQEELMARWCDWDLMPNPSRHQLHLPLPAKGPDRRLLIPVPYADPEDDYTVLINDWYTKSHTALKTFLDSGRTLGSPDGVLINGKSGKVGGQNKPLFTMKPGKTYKYRICNVGFKSTLNFRIQGHKMKLVEMEGSHVLQNDYDSLDVHVGQCFAVLVTADQAAKNYYMVASTRFLKKEVSTVGVMSYEGSNVQPSSELPKAPVGWAWSLNQYRSFRWNLTASAARPNPQGSYHYGKINITRTIKLANTKSVVNGKVRLGLTVYHTLTPKTPLKLAEYFEMSEKVFKYNVIKDEPEAKITTLTVEPNVLNITFRTFVEIVFENHEKSMQSFHLDGHSFFAVASEPGRWTPEKRNNYNLLDAVSRHTVQVYPKSWSAILLTFDNAGMWNIRSENWEKRYLGQQLYVSVLSPEKSLRDSTTSHSTPNLAASLRACPYLHPTLFN